MLSNERYL
jgi:hypothetical protein